MRARIGLGEVEWREHEESPDALRARADELRVVMKLMLSEAESTRADTRGLDPDSDKFLELAADAAACERWAKRLRDRAAKIGTKANKMEGR